MANPRAEAEDKLGGDYEARVLEPSPPAVGSPPYADDPVDPGEVPEGRKRLEPLPPAFSETRVALHKIAEAVVGPARLPANEIALRYTRGGFGTPFFEQDGADCQVRVEHGELVRQRGPEETREPLPGVDA